MPSRPVAARPVAAGVEPSRSWQQRLLRPRRGDVLLMLFVWFSTYGGLSSLGWQPPRMGDPARVAWSLAFTLPLLWRRTFPAAAALAIIPAHLVQLVTMGNFMPANMTAPIMVYAVARHAEPRWARLCLWLALAGCALAGLDWGWGPVYNPNGSLAGALVPVVANAAFCLAFVLSCWFAGQWGRQKDLTHQSWRERAEALERERAQGMALVAQEERNRLAREMHDIVAHSLSVIVVQSDGAGYLASHDEIGDPEARLAQVSRAIETIGQTAREALGETRRLVGVLRQEGDELELAPAATLDQVGSLVEQLRVAGVPANFVVEGSDQLHAPLGEGAQMAVYRVVQESLTNVMKHAGPGATVRVVLTHLDDGLLVRVSDTGTGPAADDGRGHGLVGMRERMTAWGGQLTAGPRRGGGFEVLAHLPAEPRPDATPRQEPVTGSGPPPSTGGPSSTGLLPAPGPSSSPATTSSAPTTTEETR